MFPKMQKDVGQDRLYYMLYSIVCYIFRQKSSKVDTVTKQGP
jgi:hypothetical protein